MVMGRRSLRSSPSPSMSNLDPQQLTIQGSVPGTVYRLSFDPDSRSQRDADAQSRQSYGKPPRFPVRYGIVLLGTLALSLMFAMRNSLNVTIVAMVNQTAITMTRQSSSTNGSDIAIPSTTMMPFVTDENGITHVTILHPTTIRPRLPFISTNNANETNENGTVTSSRINGINERGYREGSYVWDHSTQGIILSAYYLGYTVTQILGGRMSERWGAWWPCTIGIFVSIICTLVMPISAEAGVACISIARAVMGLFHGLVFSACYTLFSRWVPKTERATALGLLGTGGQFGSAVILPVAAVLCEQKIFGGWPSVFYISGIVSFAWLIFWSLFARSDPEYHPHITKYELSYIQDNTDGVSKSKKVMKAPWKAILTSMPVWGAAAGRVSSSFGFMVVATKLPAYFDEVLKMDLGKNGTINAFLQVAMTITSLLCGPFSDYIRRKKWVSVTTQRKMFQAVAQLGPTVCLFLVPFMNFNQNAIVALLLISRGSQGFATGGVSSIAADMAPGLSGTVFGFMNTFSSAIAFICPYLIGILLDADHASPHQWNIVFYLSSGMFLFGFIMFTLFATAEPQPWAMPPREDDDRDIKKKKPKDQILVNGDSNDDNDEDDNQDTVQTSVNGTGSRGATITKGELDPKTPLGNLANNLSQYQTNQIKNSPVIGASQEQNDQTPDSGVGQLQAIVINMENHNQQQKQQPHNHPAA